MIVPPGLPLLRSATLPSDPVASPAMPIASATARPGRFALAIAVVWVVLFGLYLMFSGTFSLNEAMTGAGASALSCVWWGFAGRGGGIRFSGWIRYLSPIGQAILALPGATAKVAGQLARIALQGGPPGAVAYERGAESAWAHGEAPAERALGLIAASLAPDSYVLREKGGDAGIVEHSLAPRGETR